MLVRPAILNAALHDYEKRMQLMKELNNTYQDDRLRSYKLILSMWLGSNHINDMIFMADQSHKLANISYQLYAMYFCLLALDKNISLINTDSEEKKQLLACRENIFGLFNTSYSLLPDDHIKFFSLVKEYIEALPGNRAKTQCLAEINKALKYPKTPEDARYKTLFNFKLNKPTKAVTRYHNNGISHLRANINRVVASELHRSTFFNGSQFLFGDKNKEKVFIETKNGILDGLAIEAENPRKDIVVLALLGSAQAEGVFVTERMENYVKFFGATTVFLNTRNASIRAHNRAECPVDLGEDVLAFAKHYIKQGKQIVLYGYCGGAAHMILAAIKLHNAGIPFKLIIDRFALCYSSFIELNSLIEVTKFFSVQPLLPAILLAKPLLHLFIHLGGCDINFAQLVAQLPEKDVLILQAMDEDAEKLVDVFITPQNGMRSYFKDLRHEHKVLLKTLRAQCGRIADILDADREMADLFHELEDFFIRCRYLIEDDKLSSKITVKKKTDLHLTELSSMKTRHEDVSASQLVQSFYARPRSDTRYFSVISPVQQDSLVATLADRYAEYPQLQPKLTELARLLASLSQTLAENQNYLNDIGSRVAEFMDINTCLHTLHKDLLRPSHRARLSH